MRVIQGPDVCIEADAGTVKIKLRSGRTLTIDVERIDEIVVHKSGDVAHGFDDGLDEVVGAHDVTAREVESWKAEGEER